MKDENEMTKDRLAKLAKVLETELANHPALDDAITPDQFVDLWKYTRLKTMDQMLALLAFGEMLSETRRPLDSFSGALLNWLDAAREVIHREEHGEQPEETSEVVH